MNKARVGKAVKAVAVVLVFLVLSAYGLTNPLERKHRLTSAQRPVSLGAVVPTASIPPSTPAPVKEGLPNSYSAEVRQWLREGGYKDISKLGPERSFYVRTLIKDLLADKVYAFVDSAKVVEEAKTGPFPKTLFLGAFTDSVYTALCGVDINERGRPEHPICDTDADRDPD